MSTEYPPAAPPPAQQPQQQPYDYGYGNGYGYGGLPSQPPAPRKTNGMAVTSMVLGIAGTVLSWFLVGIPSILAVIFGHVALKQLENNPDHGGRGMAVAGLILGYVCGGLIVLLTLFVTAIMVLLATA